MRFEQHSIIHGPLINHLSTLNLRKFTFFSTNLLSRDVGCPEITETVAPQAFGLAALSSVPGLYARVALRRVSRVALRRRSLQTTAVT